MKHQEITAEELNEKLIEYSPFRVEAEGNKEELSFKDGLFLVNNEPYDHYTVVDTENGFRINLRGLMPFHENAIIDIDGQDRFPVIVNYKGDQLLRHPDKIRHAAAEGGFFILKSIKSEK